MLLLERANLVLYLGVPTRTLYASSEEGFAFRAARDLALLAFQVKSTEKV